MRESVAQSNTERIVYMRNTSSKEYCMRLRTYL